MYAEVSPVLLPVYLRQRILGFIRLLRIGEQLDHLPVNFSRSLLLSHAVIGVGQIKKRLPVGWIVLIRLFQIGNGVRIISCPECRVAVFVIRFRNLRPDQRQQGIVKILKGFGIFLRPLPGLFRLDFFQIIRYNGNIRLICQIRIGRLHQAFHRLQIAVGSHICRHILL